MYIRNTAKNTVKPSREFHSNKQTVGRKEREKFAGRSKMKKPEVVERLV